MNADALAAYLRAQGLGTARELRIQPLAGGQSNPTFIVDDGSRRTVLRTKPGGALLASAHAIDREYRVMRALQGSAVPVPAMLAYCDDASVIGTPFYLMDYVPGRVFVDQSLPGMAPAERAAIYDELNRVIAALHAFDWRAAGLESFGRPGHYVARQIERWSRQTAATSVPVPPALRRLMDWLPRHAPTDDDEITLVHGDFRLDNVIVHPDAPRIVAVLDWELSTLGHPVADFAYHAMSWRIAPAIWRGIGGLDLDALGIPSEAAYLERYAKRTGRAPGRHWNYYLAFNLFRMSAILHGIAQRAADGNAAAVDARETGARAAPLAELGWACARQYEAGGC